MRIIVDLNAGKLFLPGAEYPVTNRVRSLKNGARKTYEVVRSAPDGLPYDPQPFPVGLWRITGLGWHEKEGFNYSTYGPVKIRTDACRWVNVWELDGEGDYLWETEKRVKDTCYWLHWSTSETTLGCIRLASPGDAVAIGEFIARALYRERVELEVR
jgi:hypothetical protein